MSMNPLYHINCCYCVDKEIEDSAPGGGRKGVLNKELRDTRKSCLWLNFWLQCSYCAKNSDCTVIYFSHSDMVWVSRYQEIFNRSEKKKINVIYY